MCIAVYEVHGSATPEPMGVLMHGQVLKASRHQTPLNLHQISLGRFNQPKSAATFPNPSISIMPQRSIAQSTLQAFLIGEPLKSRVVEIEPFSQITHSFPARYVKSENASD